VKDLVGNRRKIGFGQKLRLVLLALRENGLWWGGHLLTYYLASTVADRAFARMDRLRRERNLPGLNSPALNKRIWESWDWSSGGDEWNQSDEWKSSLIRGVLQQYIPTGCDILEIGPGGGRWTQPLLERARTYVGIDISASCIEHCQRRFADQRNAQFFVGSGRDLAAAGSASADAVWSFDVFVHINKAEVACYVQELRRVLRPGGIAVIHHGGSGGSAGGWRSDLTAADFQQMLTQHNLVVRQVLTQWADGDQIRKLTFGDLITVIAKSDDHGNPGH
jgi:SAM-dependent methyltransferase